MTKISFTDKQLETTMTALEVYSRLRCGQIGIAFDEAFYDYDLSWDEREVIEKSVKNIIFPEKPILQYDGHGGYYDQYGCTYDENRNRDSEESLEEKTRKIRPELPGNSYYGIVAKEVKDGTIAYEIYSTIRQYLALKKNDGYSGMGTQFRDPLELSGEPLPIIEDFQKEKCFVINGKSIVNKIKQYEDSKDFSRMWDTIDDYLKRHYPLDYYNKARIEKSGNHYEIYVEDAVKTKA